jgi:hypothetical protein
MLARMARPSPSSILLSKPNPIARMDLFGIGSGY